MAHAQTACPLMHYEQNLGSCSKTLHPASRILPKTFYHELLRASITSCKPLILQVLSCFLIYSESWYWYCSINALNEREHYHSPRQNNQYHIGCNWGANKHSPDNGKGLLISSTVQCSHSPVDSPVGKALLSPNSRSQRLVPKIGSIPLYTTNSNAIFVRNL